LNQPDDPERLAGESPRSELGELFASASRDVPSDEQLARLAARLGPQLGGAPAAPPAASGVSQLVKFGIAASTLALLVGGALTLRRASNPAPASVSSVVTPSVTTPVGDTMPAQPPTPSLLPATAPSASGREASTSSPALPRPGSTATSPAGTQAKPQSEAGLLEQARRALNSSPSTALLLANQHAARFPHGALTQEREVIAIEALRRLHRTSEADLRAAAFARAYPGSAHQRMVTEPTPK
jgi:hypothetical protein